MKKLKLVLPVLMAAIMVLAIPFTFACKKKNKDGALQSITLNLEGVKRAYQVGEEFNGEGLIVVANREKRDVTLTETEYALDASEYNKDEIGRYNIIVSYSDKQKSFTVTVGGDKDGIYVYFENGEDTVAVNESQTAALDLSKLVVKEVDALENVLEDEIISSDKYTVEVYRADKLIPESEYSSLVVGKYQVWVYMPSKVNPNFVRSNFVFFNVVASASGAAETVCSDYNPGE